jgi:hypothetical protein
MRLRKDGIDSMSERRARIFAALSGIFSTPVSIVSALILALAGRFSMMNCWPRDLSAQLRSQSARGAGIIRIFRAGPGGFVGHKAPEKDAVGAIRTTKAA